MTQENLIHRVALLGPPLNGKFSLLSTLARVASIVGADLTISDIKICGHSTRRTDLDLLPFDDPHHIFRIQTFSGPVFYARECLEELLQDCDGVWFLALESGINIRTTDETEIAERQAECLEYLEDVITIAERFQKKPSDVPWTLIMNQVPNELPGKGVHLRQSPWFSKTSVPIIELEAPREAAQLLAYLGDSNHHLWNQWNKA